MINYIAPIKNQLDNQMHQVCNMFMLIGSPNETPRYYNYKSLEDGILKIGSTQKNDLYFTVKTDFDFIDVNIFWQQFKEYRTEFLFYNYPSIEQYDINLTKYKYKCVLDKTTKQFKLIKK
tara:strand:+ start:94 stop:453 length:360 start_codon:yes stop_codon:yes gene_type:complete